MNSRTVVRVTLQIFTFSRPPRHVMVDGSRLPALGSSHHDCGSLEQVVMVRKRDQRVTNHHHSGGVRKLKCEKTTYTFKLTHTLFSLLKDTQSETVTYETIQTYRGHKPQRTVVLREVSTDRGSNKSENLSTAEGKIFTEISNEVESMTLTGDIGTSQSSSGSSLSSVPDSLSAESGRVGTRSNRTNSVSPGVIKKKTGMNVNYNSPLRKNVTSGVFTAFELECLRAHNEYRTKHGVPALKLSKKLCRYAEEWATIIARRGILQHRDRSPYGENIFCSWSSQLGASITVDGREPVTNWYKEVSNHAFGREPSTLKTGHFTQVIWLDSRELGVGLAKNRSGQVFVVANYDPPGNFIGSFTSNVPPIGGFTSNLDVLDSISPTLELDDEVQAFSKAILKHHNDYRRSHKVDELVLDQELTISAHQWAHNLAKEDRFGHNPRSLFGENLYCLWSSDRNAKANPKEVCKSWYEEIRDFQFGIEPRGLVKAAQFTQLVWKATKKLGVGMAKTRSGKVIVVCTYDPRGNVIGQYNSNVMRLRRI